MVTGMDFRKSTMLVVFMYSTWETSASTRSISSKHTGMSLIWSVPLSLLRMVASNTNSEVCARVELLRIGRQGIKGCDVVGGLARNR